MSPLYEHQLEFIRWLHQFSNPWLDGFFKFLNFFDRQEFYLVLIPVVWIGYHWRSGLRILYILTLSAVVNNVLKDLIMEPRPFHIDPTLAIIQVSGYGFPSGAAQTVILLSGILLNNFRNKGTWILCINYVFWVSLSRVYLGVHVPTDVLGGWVVGGLLWALYTYGRPPLEKWLEKRSLPLLFILSLAAPLLLLLAWPPLVPFYILAMTVGVGLIISYYFKILLPSSKSRVEFLRRASLGVAGAFACALVPHTYLFPILVGLWLSLISNLIFQNFPLHK